MEGTLSPLLLEHVGSVGNSLAFDSSSTIKFAFEKASLVAR